MQYRIIRLECWPSDCTSTFQRGTVLHRPDSTLAVAVSCKTSPRSAEALQTIKSLKQFLVSVSHLCGCWGYSWTNTVESSCCEGRGCSSQVLVAFSAVSRRIQVGTRGDQAMSLSWLMCLPRPLTCCCGATLTFEKVNTTSSCPTRTRHGQRNSTRQRSSFANLSSVGISNAALLIG
jgi:hypothetical protein